MLVHAMCGCTWGEPKHSMPKPSIDLALPCPVPQVQQAKDRAACLEAQSARLAAAAEVHELERAYLVAERRLMAAQARRLRLTLAARASEAHSPAAPAAGIGAAPAGDGGSAGPAATTAAAAAAAARQEAREAEARAADAWSRLPARCALRALSGPRESCRELRVLAQEVAQVIAAQQSGRAEAEARACAAEQRATAAEARQHRLSARLKSVAKVAAARAAEAKAGGEEAAAALTDAHEQQERLEQQLEEMVRAAWEVHVPVPCSSERSLRRKRAQTAQETCLPPLACPIAARHAGPQPRGI
jgi:colicin import membrane protein